MGVPPYLWPGCLIQAGPRDPGQTSQSQSQDSAGAVGEGDGERHSFTWFTKLVAYKPGRVSFIRWGGMSAQGGGQSKEKQSQEMEIDSWRRYWNAWDLAALIKNNPLDFSVISPTTFSFLEKSSWS